MRHDDDLTPSLLAPEILPSEPLHETPPSPRAVRRRRIAKIVGTALSLALFAISLAVLTHVATNIKPTELRAAIAATSNWQIFVACVLAMVSYLALTGYDALAVRQMRLRVPYRTTSLGSFTSYAISFTLGFPLITGGTVRYWIYSRAGLSAGQVASLTIIAGVTFWIGMACVVGTSLIFAAEPLSNLDHLAPALNRLIGLAAIAAIIISIVWTARTGRRRVRIQGFRLDLPGPLVMLGQITLGVADVCAAAGVLFVLLPPVDGLDFIAFVGLYVFACMLGIASHAPGGIGVFEATMLRFTPGASGEAVLAALLLFRVIYYLIPFVLALALLGADEAVRRWSALREAMSTTGDRDDEP